MFTAVGYQVLIRGFRLALSVEGLRPHTIDNYVRDVERFAASHEGVDPQAVSSTHVRAYVLDLKVRLAPKTVYEAQLALRRFFRFLVREGDIQRDPTENMKLTRYRVDPQPTYTDAEVKRLLLACNMKAHTGIRDRALVMVLYDTGVREGELVSMGMPDWEARQVQVVGKGGVRRVPTRYGGTTGGRKVCPSLARDGGPTVEGQEGPVDRLGCLSANHAPVPAGWRGGQGRTCLSPGGTTVAR